VKALRRLAALLLAVQAWAAGVPAGHAALEALHHASSAAASRGAALSRGTAVDASCDPGCGHSHRVHDPATCGPCRSLAGAVAQPAVAATALVEPASFRAQRDEVFVALAAVAGRPCTRGPPSLLG
jgi:hypothetical protein